ncbi:hypothetical protein XM38_044790 [Halomicronema hongdechloris C2206]|uniref:Tetratricopeptide repeat protein n=1 Tax=Halomicronema hongdechloris C2206 TaxID=1641165 RepID=A0A1Z3HTD0_9CYAN|nr:hypothetical protein [Halomicronema hongdechloris]ASC73512.1 hypothetical protein XM38_044790 [Halomicronema hongdechloris C2206]
MTSKSIIQFRSEWRKAVHETLVASSATAGVVFGGVRLLKEFGLLTAVSIQSTGSIGLLAAFSICLAGGLIATLVRMTNRYIKVKDNIHLSVDKDEVILDLLNELFDERRHDEVIIIGFTLSRILWVQGRWQTRVAIGYLLEKSAITTSEPNYEVYLHALVDMIGWTSAMLGDHVTGEMYLKRAVQYSNEHISKSPACAYYLAKGYRHLGGIAYRKENFSADGGAKFWLDKALESAENISLDTKKQEMVAGIEYGISEIFIRQESYCEAEKHSLKSEKIYTDIGDEVRKIKVLNQKGQIYFSKNAYPQAYSAYSQAIFLAERDSRKEQRAEAYYGLGLLYLAEAQISKGQTRSKKRNKAIENLEKARNFMEEIGIDSDYIFGIEKEIKRAKLFK